MGGRIRWANVENEEERVKGSGIYTVLMASGKFWPTAKRSSGMHDFSPTANPIIDLSDRYLWALETGVWLQEQRPRSTLSGK